MTISIQVSVNGNYKCPVTVQYGEEPASTEVVSGRGLDKPNVKYISYYSGQIVNVTVGPEEPDNG